MKNLFVIISIVLLSVSCIRVNENPVPSANLSFHSGDDGLFLHVTKGADHQHEVLMALSMATKFMDTHDVLIYFDIHGIEMVTKYAPNLEMEPFGSSDALFEKLINGGVTLFACPGCMKVEGVSASDLRTGVRVADKDEFFDFTNGRILSLDY